MGTLLINEQAKYFAEHPELLKLQITEDYVQMPTFAAFDLLYRHDRKLWENVLDALIDIAQEKFLEFHKVDPEDDNHNYYLEDGIDFEGAFITVNR